MSRDNVFDLRNTLLKSRKNEREIETVRKELERPCFHWRLVPGFQIVKVKIRDRYFTIIEDAIDPV